MQEVSTIPHRVSALNFPNLLLVCFVCRFDEAVEQYHRALSLQPAFSFCADMLSQALEDMSTFKGVQIAERQASTQHLDQLFPPDQREGDPLAHIDASTVPLDMHGDTSFNVSSSFRIHHDVSSYSPVFAGGGDGISRIDGSGVSRRGVGGRVSTGSAMSFEGSFEEEDSVESYSRIAGRLSLDSTMSNS
jgi:hypothetical protein